MTKEECHFCHGGDRFMPDTIKAIDNHIQNPEDLLGLRLCALCTKIVCIKAMAVCDE